VARVAAGPVRGSGQPAHGRAVAGAGGGVGDRAAVPADGVPGTESGGGAVAAREGAGDGRRADPGPERRAGPGVRRAVPDGTHRAPPTRRRTIRELLATYLA